MLKQEDFSSVEVGALGTIANFIEESDERVGDQTYEITEDLLDDLHGKSDLLDVRPGTLEIKQEEYTEVIFGGLRVCLSVSHSRFGNRFFASAVDIDRDGDDETGTERSVRFRFKQEDNGIPTAREIGGEDLRSEPGKRATAPTLGRVVLEISQIVEIASAARNN